MTQSDETLPVGVSTTHLLSIRRKDETGPTDNIFAQSRHPYTSALLAANPEPDPDAETSHIELQGEMPSLVNRPSGCEFHTRCPFTQDQCREQLPDLTGDAAHYFRCHFPLHEEK